VGRGLGGWYGVGLAQDEMLDLLGMEFSASLQDSEGEHRGDDEFVLLEQSSASEVEGDV
jgi:hypothetical protein